MTELLSLIAHHSSDNACICTVAAHSQHGHASPRCPYNARSHCHGPTPDIRKLSTTRRSLTGYQWIENVAYLYRTTYFHNSAEGVCGTVECCDADSPRELSLPPRCQRPCRHSQHDWHINPDICLPSVLRPDVGCHSRYCSGDWRLCLLGNGADVSCCSRLCTANKQLCVLQQSKSGVGRHRRRYYQHRPSLFRLVPESIVCIHPRLCDGAWDWTCRVAQLLGVWP